MEYYSALERMELLTRDTPWMNIEDSMLSEISQSRKDKCCVILVTGGTEGGHGLLAPSVAIHGTHMTVSRSVL